jgi:hypothetical protein
MLVVGVIIGPRTSGRAIVIHGVIVPPRRGLQAHKELVRTQDGYHFGGRFGSATIGPHGAAAQDVAPIDREAGTRHLHPRIGRRGEQLQLGRGDFRNEQDIVPLARLVQHVLQARHNGWIALPAQCAQEYTKGLCSGPSRVNRLLAQPRHAVVI